MRPSATHSVRAVVLGVALSGLLLGGGCSEIFPQRSEGERLYLKRCAECHGVDGAGNTPRYMGNAMADLLDDQWEYGGDPASMRNVIRDGIFGEMPANEDLTLEQVDAIVDYVRKLRGEGY